VARLFSPVQPPKSFIMEDIFLIFGAVSFALSSVLFVLILACYLAAPSPHSNERRLDDINSRLNVLEEGNEAALRDLRGWVYALRLRCEDLTARLSLLPTRETIDNLEKQIAQGYAVLTRSAENGLLPFPQLEGPQKASASSAQPLYTPLTTSTSLTASLHGLSGHPPVPTLPLTTIDSFNDRLRAIQQLSVDAQKATVPPRRNGSSRDRAAGHRFLRNDNSSSAAHTGDNTFRVTLSDSKLVSDDKISVTRL